MGEEATKECAFTAVLVSHYGRVLYIYHVYSLRIVTGEPSPLNEITVTLLQLCLFPNEAVLL